jgi:hypothetical protein
MREQGFFDPAKLVFIDETSTNTMMVRLRGRSPRGERLCAARTLEDNHFRGGSAPVWNDRAVRD